MTKDPITIGTSSINQLSEMFIIIIFSYPNIYVFQSLTALILFTGKISNLHA